MDLNGSYTDGMEAIADRYTDVIGVDLLSTFATLAKAAGEVMDIEGKRKAEATATAEEKARLVAVGESAFNAMKGAAQAAKWPADLTPQVVFLDKAWQATKAGSNLAEIQRLTIEMQAMATQLGGRVGGVARPPGGAMVPYQPTPGRPWWHYGLGALALGGVGYGAYRLIKR